MSDHDEPTQLLIDSRDHWQRRALAAEKELIRWHGYLNQQRPDLKKTILQRLAQIFHLKRVKK